MNYFIWSLISLFVINDIQAQTDSIFDQGKWRTFIVHRPSGYTISQKYSVVINLHGLNSDAAQQQAYSQFDKVADTEKLIVVYPNGISKQWNIANNTDVDFISHLVDTLRARYSCNSCLFATGISDGGFMTYKLVCALSKPLTAIAVVSGNMAITLQSNCPKGNGVPVIHFHGTADKIVSYNGAPPLIPKVDSTVMWWVKKNGGGITAAKTSIPNINTADSCQVEEYDFQGSGTQVIFYKIINGGHTWPGSYPAPPLGNTNQDINASAIIGNFFSSYCEKVNGTKQMNIHEGMRVFPIPASLSVTIEFPKSGFDIIIYDAIGRIVYSQNDCGKNLFIPTGNWGNGVFCVCALRSGLVIKTPLIVGSD